MEFQVFFWATAATGGVFLWSERNYDSEWHVQFDHQFLSRTSMVASVARKTACRDRFWNPALCLNRLLPVSNEMEEIAHVEEGNSDKTPKTS
jgi:hypothetical protein